MSEYVDRVIVCDPNQDNLARHVSEKQWKMSHGILEESKVSLPYSSCIS